MDDPIRKYCLQKGYAQHVVNGGLDYLITKWEYIAMRMASGYRFGIDDFRNNMDIRRILGEVLSVVTHEQREATGPRLKKADELFIESTVESPECIWGSDNAQEHEWSKEKEWFYYRVPVGLLSWFEIDG